MNVPLYEKIWMWAAGGISVAFAATVLITSIGGALQPPSHVETIDPAQVFKDPRFAHPGVTVDAHGTTVVAVGMMFAYVPAEIHVPAGKPVTFRMTSADVRRPDLGMKRVRTPRMLCAVIPDSRLSAE